MAASSVLEDVHTEGSEPSKIKVEQKKKAELIREIHKLDVQIQAMEKERLTHVFNKRSDFLKDFSVLEENDAKLLEERKLEYTQMCQQLSKIGHMVKRFQRELTNIKPTPEFVEKLKQIMEEIEKSINTFKGEQKQKYEELLREERTLLQELQTMERMFDAWAASTNVPASLPYLTSSHKPLASARDITKDLPPEVAAFEKFLEQTGGHRGGWDEYDHGTFLKIRIKYKGRITFLDHLKGLLPTKTEDEVREHETWYQEYLFLKERKKDSIKSWREKKEEERDELLTKADEKLKNKNDEEEEEAERKKRLQEKVEAEKRERFSHLNSWKVQKELEKAIEEEKKMREELAKVKKIEDERKRQAEVRAQVDEFRRQREEEEALIRQHEELKKQQEAEQRRQESAREIVKFRSRDYKKLYDRVAKEMEKENLKREKEKQLEKLRKQVEPDVVRDPNRLLQPTAGWKAHLDDSGSIGSSGGRVLHMPHRAIPNWRKQ